MESYGVPGSRHWIWRSSVSTSLRFPCVSMPLASPTSKTSGAMADSPWCWQPWSCCTELCEWCIVKTCEVCLFFDTLPWFLLQNPKGHGFFIQREFLNCGRMVHRAGYYIPYTMQIFQFCRRHFGHCKNKPWEEEVWEIWYVFEVGSVMQVCEFTHFQAIVTHPFTTEWNSQPYCAIRYCDGVWVLFKHRCTCFALQLTWRMWCGLHSGWPGSNLWGFCLTLRWLAWECWASLWNLSCSQEIKAAIDLGDIEVAGSNLDSLS